MRMESSMNFTSATGLVPTPMKKPMAEQILGSKRLNNVHRLRKPIQSTMPCLRGRMQVRERHRDDIDDPSHKSQIQTISPSVQPIRRRPKPAWNNSVKNDSEYKFSAGQQYRRRMQMISTNNYLAIRQLRNKKERTTSKTELDRENITGYDGVKAVDLQHEIDHYRRDRRAVCDSERTVNGHTRESIRKNEASNQLQDHQPSTIDLGDTQLQYQELEDEGWESEDDATVRYERHLENMQHILRLSKTGQGDLSSGPQKKVDAFSNDTFGTVHTRDIDKGNPSADIDRGHTLCGSSTADGQKFYPGTNNFEQELPEIVVEAIAHLRMKLQEQENSIVELRHEKELLQQSLQMFEQDMILLKSHVRDVEDKLQLEIEVNESLRKSHKEAQTQLEALDSAMAKQPWKEQTVYPFDSDTQSFTRKGEKSENLLSEMEKPDLVYSSPLLSRSALKMDWRSVEDSPPVNPLFTSRGAFSTGQKVVKRRDASRSDTHSSNKQGTPMTRRVTFNLEDSSHVQTKAIGSAEMQLRDQPITERFVVEEQAEVVEELQKAVQEGTANTTPRFSRAPVSTSVAVDMPHGASGSDSSFVKKHVNAAAYKFQNSKITVQASPNSPLLCTTSSFVTPSPIARGFASSHISAEKISPAAAPKVSNLSQETQNAEWGRVRRVLNIGESPDERQSEVRADIDSNYWKISPQKPSKIRATPQSAGPTNISSIAVQ